MHSSFTESIARLWQGVRKKTHDAVEDQEVAWIRGRVAARPVMDAAGNLIVDAGHPIDDAVIARARAAGRLSAVLAVAATAKAQDIKEKLSGYYDRTLEGQEAHALQSVDSYIEARRYIGRVLEMDVTDLRGNVIVPTGKQIDDNDVRACREAQQLGALIAAAEQAPPAPAGFVPMPAASEQEHAFYTPPPPRVAPTFLAPLDEDEEKGL